MVKYLLDPEHDATEEEMERIFACKHAGQLWERGEIPEGCERHFVEVNTPDGRGDYDQR